jgi:hypothetical protein
MLRALATGLYTTGVEHLDIRSACLLAFFALLRVSEFTKKTRGGVHDPAQHLTRGDFEFFPSQANPEGMRVTISASKVDQYRAGVTLVVYASGDPSFCAVTTVKALFDADPAPMSAPAFDYKPRSTNTTGRTRENHRDAFNSVFKRIVQAAGLEVSEIKTHSLRAGGATALLRAGIQPIVVTKLGRWASWSWTTYTWASEGHIRDAHKAIATITGTAAPVDLTEVRQGHRE